MWAKLSSALRLPEAPSLNLDEDEAPNVMGGVYAQHPNLSVFHEPSEQASTDILFPSPSPPLQPDFASNSKEPTPESSTAKLQVVVAEDVKPSLRSTDALGSRFSVSRASRDSEHTPLPSTPNGDRKFASVRSILRQPHTPATGQSVRFFSRDAYKIITPDVTDGSGSHEDASFAARISAAGLARSTPVRKSTQELFAEPFDISQPTIPPGASLLDSAVEVDDDDIRSMVLEDSIVSPVLEAPVEIMEAVQPSPEWNGLAPAFDRRLDRHSSMLTSGPRILQPDRLLDAAGVSDGGRTLVQPAEARTPPLLRGHDRQKNDSSDPVMQAQTNLKAEGGGAVASVTPDQKERFLSGEDATTYHTPGADVPSTPPHPTHIRTASQEDGLIASLRVQLALQVENVKLLEEELATRNELNTMLGQRLEMSESECERRKTAVRSWRKRVTELERCLQALQEEVDRSREESLEKHGMAEASGEVLRMLHQRLESLNQDKTQNEDELEKAKREVERPDQVQVEIMPQGSMIMSHHQSSRVGTWEEERAQLLAANEALHCQLVTAENQTLEARREISRKDNELHILKAELEAQWKHTETSGEKVQQLEQQRGELMEEVERLNQRIANMELDWTDAENRRAEAEAEVQEAWATRDELEREHNELEDQLRAEQEHADQLTRALQEREDHAASLERDAQYAQDKIAKLEKKVQQRDAETTELMQRMAARQAEAEAVQEEITRIKREHARTLDEQNRKLQEVAAREGEARAGLEQSVRAKAETDVSASSFKDKIKALMEETEKLRRQIHTLQQESADKEVRLVNFAKQRAQDKEDIQGLNIALDSKQQELELLKRRMSVRGTGTSTPASTARVVPSRRRESSIFGTPAVPSSRPPSVISDASSGRDIKNMKTPTTVTKKALVRTTRTNASATQGHLAKRLSEGGMGPPPRRVSVSAMQTGSRASLPNSMRSTSVSIPRPSSGPISDPSRLQDPRPTPPTLDSVDVSSESDDKEKENTDPTDKTPRAAPIPA